MVRVAYGRFAILAMIRDEKGMRDEGKKSNSKTFFLTADSLRHFSSLLQKNQ
jgi:hypothetical protein